MMKMNAPVLQLVKESSNEFMTSRSFVSLTIQIMLGEEDIVTLSVFIMIRF